MNDALKACPYKLHEATSISGSCEGIDHLQHNNEINNLLLQKVSSIYIQ